MISPFAANLARVSYTMINTPFATRFALRRKQIMFFTAQVLDEQPDPTMLLEIENQDGNGGDDDAGEE